MNRDPEAWKRLGRLIRDAREQRGLSREELAALADVSERSVFSAEVAYGTKPPLRQQPPTLTRIVAALGWDPASIRTILNGGDPSPTQAAGGEPTPAAPAPEPSDSDRIFTDPYAQAIWELDLPVEERLREIRVLMDAQLERAAEAERQREAEEEERRRRTG